MSATPSELPPSPRGMSRAEFIASCSFVHVAAAVECAGNFNNFAANSGASSSKAQPLMPHTSVALGAD